MHGLTGFLTGISSQVINCCTNFRFLNIVQKWGDDYGTLLALPRPPVRISYRCIHWERPENNHARGQGAGTLCRRPREPGPGPEVGGQPRS